MDAVFIIFCYAFMFACLAIPVYKLIDRRNKQKQIEESSKEIIKTTYIYTDGKCEYELYLKPASKAVFYVRNKVSNGYSYKVYIQGDLKNTVLKAYGLI